MITRTSVRARKRLGTFGFLNHVGKAGRALAGLGQTGVTLQPIGLTAIGNTGLPSVGMTGGTANFGLTSNSWGSTPVQGAPPSAAGTIAAPSGVPVSTGVGTVTSAGSSGLSSTQWLVIAAIGLGALVLLWPPTMKAPSTP